MTSDLRNPRRAEEPNEQRAADRREQQCYTKRDMTARTEIADLHALRILEDEDKQQDQQIAPATKPLNAVDVRVRGGFARARRGSPARPPSPESADTGLAGLSALEDSAGWLN